MPVGVRSSLGLIVIEGVYCATDLSVVGTATGEGFEAKLCDEEEAGEKNFPPQGGLSGEYIVFLNLPQDPMPGYGVSGT